VAVEVKVLKVGSDVLTDLRPGKTRKTIYSPAGQLGAMTAFMLGLGAVAVAPGIMRMVAGSSPRAAAREELEDNLLAAKITGEQQKADFLEAQRRLLEREFDPTSEAERAAKLKAIQDSLPLDLSRRELSLEAERAATARADELFPLVLQEREQALQIQGQLATERAERQAEFIATERAKRELFAEETERAALLNRQLEQQTALIEAAIGPLDAAQAAQFARERLFPPAAPKPPTPIGALSRPGAFAGSGF